MVSVSLSLFIYSAASPCGPSVFPFLSACCAVRQVYEDLRAMSLSLDDVAEFTGMLDNDVEDIGF